MAEEGAWRARYSRQILLSGVGEAGQLRVMSGVARVPEGGLSGDVARAYSRRAGFASVAEGPSETAPSFVTSPAAREVVEGSLAALREIASACGD